MVIDLLADSYKKLARASIFLFLGDGYHLRHIGSSPGRNSGRDLSPSHLHSEACRMLRFFFALREPMEPKGIILPSP